MLLLEHFDELTLRPENVEQLKGMMLQLAIQGKLTAKWRAENPDLITGDHSAEALLARIQEEKQHLIAEGKLRKEKPLPAITEDEKPFGLPEGWVWCRLGSASIYGQTEKVNHKDLGDVNTWVLELEDIEKVSSRLIQKIYSNERVFKSTKARFKKGDILYGKLRPYLDKVIVADENGVCTTEIIPIDVLGAIASSYLRWVLKSSYFVQYANESTHGMNLPRLGTDKAREAIIPLCSKSEQIEIARTIAFIFKEIDQLVQQTQHRITLKKDYAQSALHQLTNSDTTSAWQDLRDHFPTFFDEVDNIEALRAAVLQLAVQGKLTTKWRAANPDLITRDNSAEALLARIREEKQQLIAEGKLRKEKPLPPITEDEKPFELPEGWVWCRLGELGDWGAGATPLRSNPAFYNGNINWYKSGELNNSVMDYDSEEKITELALEKSSVRLNNPGDVLIAMYGATIGKTGIVNRECTTNQAVCACTCFKGFLNEYLQLSLNALKSVFANQGEGGAQPNISRIKIRNQEYALPGSKEQLAILEITSKLFQEIDQLEKQITQKEELSDRLMRVMVKA